MGKSRRKQSRNPEEIICRRLRKTIEWLAEKHPDKLNRVFAGRFLLNVGKALARSESQLWQDKFYRFLDLVLLLLDEFCSD